MSAIIDTIPSLRSLSSSKRYGRTAGGGGGSTAALGLVAGLAGTVAMMAMRRFDQTYAPGTIAKMREDPGEYIVHQIERAAGLEHDVPGNVEKPAAMAVHVGYGTLAGLMYALLRGRRRPFSTLAEGAALGVAVYALGYLGWIPLLGLGRPAWKQSFPANVGEMLRHIAYGVTTVATFGLLRR